MQHRTQLLRRHGVFFMLAIAGLVVIISSRLLLVTGVPRQATAEPMQTAPTASDQKLQPSSVVKVHTNAKPVEAVQSH